MYVSCFRYLGMSSFEEVHALYWHEYELLMKADRLKRVDKERDMHWQSWLNQQAKATTGKGDNIKPKYRTFDKFFDYDAAIKRAKDPYEEDEPKHSAKVIDMMTREITL